MRQTVKWTLVVGLAALALSGAWTLAQEPGGKELYQAKCAMCHGADGTAKEMWAKKGMKNFNDPAWQKAHTDEAITKTVTEGIADKKMPAYKDKLKADEIQTIVKYIRTLAPQK